MESMPLNLCSICYNMDNENIAYEGTCRLQDAVPDLGATTILLIVVDENFAQSEIVVVPVACSNITMDEMERCCSLIENAAIVLLQHEINFHAQEKVIEIAHNAGVKIVLNPAPAIPMRAEIDATVKENYNI